MSGAVIAGFARMFANPEITYRHAYKAKPGGFAARIDRLDECG